MWRNFPLPLLVILACGVVAAQPEVVTMSELNVVGTREIALGVHEGGISGLTHIPGDPNDIVYAVCDRGINGEATVDGESRRTFPAPDFGPTIYKIKLAGDEARILERTRLRLPRSGDAASTAALEISGLPNVEGLGEAGYDITGRKLLPFDPHGLDVEGIAYNPADDSFWFCDEYGPSLVHTRRDGELIERLVPVGMAARLGTDYVRDTLPAIYGRREENRGFEGIAVSPGGKYLFAALQSPLENPKKKTANNSRHIRLLKLDLKTLRPVGEFVYQTEDAAGFGLRQRNLVVSDLVALDDDRLIVDERDNQAGTDVKVKRLYIVDTARATNLLDSELSAREKGETLEALTPEHLGQLGIASPPKTLLLDLARLGYGFEKLEGVCMIDPSTLVIANDNDFGIAYEKDRMIHTKITSRLTVIRLAEPIQ